MNNSLGIALVGAGLTLGSTLIPLSTWDLPRGTFWLILIPAVMSYALGIGIILAARWIRKEYHGGHWQ